MVYKIRIRELHLLHLLLYQLQHIYIHRYEGYDRIDYYKYKSC